MRILLIQHDTDTPLGALGEPLLERGDEIVEWRVADGGPPPLPLEDVDAMVVLGGIAMPDQDDQFPWLSTEDVFIRAALERGTPYLGVCLGGQMLARAAGGRVRPADASEIGWYDVGVLPAAADDPIFGGLEVGFRAFEWHHYAFDLPPGAQLLARNRASNQAFRVGERAWGMQFHIEVTPAIVAMWSGLGATDFRHHGIDPDDVAADTAADVEASMEAARDLMRRFVETAERIGSAAPLGGGARRG